MLLLTAWARDGLTDEQIANKMNIGTRTLYEYKERYPQISQSLKGKEIIDCEVENSLLKRALGYEYDEIKEEYEADILIKKTIIRKTVVPDVAAQFIWLKNRLSKKWRDKPIDIDSSVEQINKNIQDLVGILKQTAPERKISDE